MKLAKQPETEREFWEAIEYFGATAHEMNRNLVHGYIENPTGKFSKR